MPRVCVRIHMLIVLSATCVCACGKKNYLNENDALRAKVLDQQKELDDLKRRTEELRIEVQSLTTAPGEVSEEVLLATPRPVELSIGRWTHVQFSEGEPARLVLYVSPVDGRGRFTQLVGSIQISAFLLPMNGEPSTIGTLTCGPLEVREAYRHTLMSTHYTFDVPLNLPPLNTGSAEQQTVFVRAVFTDGYTGQTLTAEGSVAVKQERQP